MDPIYDSSSCNTISIQNQCPYDVSSNSPVVVSSSFIVRQKRLIPAQPLPNARKFHFAHLGWKKTHLVALIGYCFCIALLIAQCYVPIVYFQVRLQFSLSTAIFHCIRTEKHLLAFTCFIQFWGKYRKKRVWSSMLVGLLSIRKNRSQLSETIFDL